MPRARRARWNSLLGSEWSLLELGQKAQAIGVNGLWDPVRLEGGAEVGEVVPCGVGGHETPGDIEAGMVVNGEQENLLGQSGPALVNRAVMLPEVADFGTAETPVGAGLSHGSRHEMLKMGFDVSLDAGTCAGEAAEAQQLIADELVIGRILKRKEARKKSMNLWRPRHEMVASTGAGLEAMPPAQPRATELVETGFADPQGMGSLVGIHVPGIEIGKDPKNEIFRQPVNDLMLFKAGMSLSERTRATRNGLPLAVLEDGDFSAA